MTTLLAAWSAHAVQARATPILPDGCRDLICRQRPGQGPHWFISPLQSAPSPSMMRAGDLLHGFRLAPGTRIDQKALLHAVQGNDPEFHSTNQHLVDHTHHTTRLGEALDCLMGTPTIVQTASELGVSLRALQRLVARETGRSPAFWRQLARIRGAGRMLASGTDFAEAAYLAGFADQAHMNRNFRRWFGVTPREFLGDTRLHSQLGSLAYG